MLFGLPRCGSVHRLGAATAMLATAWNSSNVAARAGVGWWQLLHASGYTTMLQRNVFCDTNAFKTQCTARVALYPTSNQNFNPNMSSSAPAKVNVFRPSPGLLRPSARPFERPSFESGKPVCPSGVPATQGSSRVQRPDGTWTTVATGAWNCGEPRIIGVAR
jgi:hypothetical protein